MGVKGLQLFTDSCCPAACVTVCLREMARQHVTQHQRGCPTLVVDGMACLRPWYSCKDWVCGGQWREYMDVLKGWVEAFTSAGIRLVFFFDGVVEEQKRQVWVKRRRRVNGEISKMFRHIKAYGKQPGRELFCLPSGLATFTCFALRALGQEVFCSVREADYEIASYARQHGSMGILGQDSDFIIYDSAPYLSVAKLRMDSLTTVMYDRHRLCQAIGLTVTQLPLLACLLGNDVVSEEKMQPSRISIRHSTKVLAVSHLVSSLWGREEQETELIPQSLDLSAPHRELLKRGVCSYLLPGHKAFPQGDISAQSFAFEKHVSPEILKVCSVPHYVFSVLRVPNDTLTCYVLPCCLPQACREKHVATEGFMVYSVVCQGVIECSNTLEDEENAELLPQALVYKPCRQRIYGLLLLHGHDGSSVDLPAIREWFVYPGNPLKEPDMVHPVQISLPCTVPACFLICCSLHLLTYWDVIELTNHILSTVHLFVCFQVHTLSQEDVDAYLSQAVCLRLKSPDELQQIKLPVLSSRAVQLGSLYVRGLSNLLGGNCASGCPLPNAALMPWHSFDGRLFHSKYLLAHSGTEKTVLLDSDSSCLSLFLRLKEKLTETCRKRGRVLQSRPCAPEQGHRITPGPRHREKHAGEM
uniref:Family with sequence similarity 120 member B n=1 Tax=Cyclopterus lumpus TaxID=8103 RepID=A0A8C2ZPB0_CYCLU